MRVAYVAGRTNDWRLVREIQVMLRRNGYEISYDWTKFVEGVGDLNERDGSLSEEVMAEQAQKDLEAATEELSECDDGRFVLFCYEDMHDAMGCYIELGAALWENRMWNYDIKIDIIQPPRHSIFFNLPNVTVYPNVQDWQAQFS